MRAIVVPGLGKRGTRRGRRELIRLLAQEERSCSEEPNRDCRAFAAVAAFVSSTVVWADAVVVTDVGKVWEVWELPPAVVEVMVVTVLVAVVVTVAAAVGAEVEETEVEDRDNLENSPLTRMGSFLVIADPCVCIWVITGSPNFFFHSPTQPMNSANLSFGKASISSNPSTNLGSGIVAAKHRVK